MSDTTVTLSEVFGPTIQGEGPLTGRVATFVRFGRCNLDCSWCDTPYTWDWSGRNGVAYDPSMELLRVGVKTLVHDVHERGAPLVVITGGEPAAQPAALKHLTTELLDLGHSVQIETNATLRLPWTTLPDDLWVVASPKLANSGIAEHRRITPHLATLLALGNRAVFKFVTADSNDLDEIAALTARYNIPPHRVWIMPEGRDAITLTTRLALLADDIIANGWNISTRLHVHLWGDRRAV